MSISSLPAPGAVLVESSSIRERVAELAAVLDAHYAAAQQPLLLLCVLNGSLMFTADLARALTIPLEVACIAVRSYGDSTHSSGTVELVADLAPSVTGRDVLVVEDIVDSGRTVHFLRAHLAAQGAASVRVVALLDKTARRAVAVDVEWTGFDIPDSFVVGYGLDYDGRWRNLAAVHVLDGV